MQSLDREHTRNKPYHPHHPRKYGSAMLVLGGVLAVMIVAGVAETAFALKRMIDRAEAYTNGLIPRLADQNPCAQSRRPMEVMRQG